jgi:DNA polymerase III delta prime subunit
MQKIIENVQSRTFIVQLEIPKPQYLNDLHDKIMEKEGLDIWIDKKDELKKYLLSICNNNYRELINIMEKIIVYIGKNPTEPITLEICKSLFLTRIYHDFTDYIEHLKNGKLGKAIQIMNKIVANGYSVVDIFDSFFKFIKTTEVSLILNETQIFETVKLLCEYITLVHIVHEESVELVLFTNNLYKLLDKYS